VDDLDEYGVASPYEDDNSRYVWDWCGERLVCMNTLESAPSLVYTDMDFMPPHKVELIAEWKCELDERRFVDYIVQVPILEVEVYYPSHGEPQQPLTVKVLSEEGRFLFSHPAWNDVDWEADENAWDSVVENLRHKEKGGR